MSKQARAQAWQLSYSPPKVAEGALTAFIAFAFVASNT
jgi:hypothetical protein